MQRGEHLSRSPHEHANRAGTRNAIAARALGPPVELQALWQGGREVQGRIRSDIPSGIQGTRGTRPPHETFQDSIHVPGLQRGRIPIRSRLAARPRARSESGRRNLRDRRCVEGGVLRFRDEGRGYAFRADDAEAVGVASGPLCAAGKERSRGCSRPDSRPVGHGLYGDVPENSREACVQASPDESRTRASNRSGYGFGIEERQ